MIRIIFLIIFVFAISFFSTGNNIEYFKITQEKKYNIDDVSEKEKCISEGKCEREILVVNEESKDIIKRKGKNILPYNLRPLAQDYGNFGMTAGNDGEDIKINYTSLINTNNQHLIEFTSDDMEKIISGIETTYYPFPNKYYVYLDKIYHIPNKNLLTLIINNVLNKINNLVNKKISNKDNYNSFEIVNTQIQHIYKGIIDTDKGNNFNNLYYYDVDIYIYRKGKILNVEKCFPDIINNNKCVLAKNISEEDCVEDKMYGFIINIKTYTHNEKFYLNKISLESIFLKDYIEKIKGYDKLPYQFNYSLYMGEDGKDKYLNNAEIKKDTLKKYNECLKNDWKKVYNSRDLLDLRNRCNYIWLDNNSVTDNYWPDNREYTSNADLQETIGENDSEENIDIEAKNVLNKKKKSYQPISKSFQGDKEEALYGHSTEV